MDKRTIAGGIALLGMLLAAAWWMGWLDGESADITQIKQLAVQPPSEDRDKQMREVVREKMQGMTPEQRQSYFESMAPVFIPLMAMQFEQRYDAHMAKSPEEQRKALDQVIDQMENGRRGAQQQQQSRPPGQAGGGGARRTMDPKKADEMRKKMLAYVTPQQRSKFDNGIQMLNQRRKERGLEPIKPPGGGRW